MTGNPPEDSIHPAQRPDLTAGGQPNGPSPRLHRSPAEQPVSGGGAVRAPLPPPTSARRRQVAQIWRATNCRLGLHGGGSRDDPMVRPYPGRGHVSEPAAPWAEVRCWRAQTPAEAPRWAIARGVRPDAVTRPLESGRSGAAGATGRPAVRRGLPASALGGERGRARAAPHWRAT
jgi:hypothetical protein